MLMKIREKMKKANNQKGFTLVELMVVVVIIGVLIAIAVPVYQNVTEKAEKNACHANQRTIEGAASMYRTVHNNNEWPPNGNVDSNHILVNGGYLQSAPKCPKSSIEYILTNDGKVQGCSSHGHYTDS